MFEQATLASGPAGKRVWTTLLGMTGQVALVSLAILLPLVSPQVLPLARLEISLAPPVPPGPPKLGGETQRRPGHTTVVRTPFRSLLDYAPVSVPKGVPTIVDEPSEMFIPGGTGASPGGVRDGVVGADILQNIFANARPVPLPHIPEPVPAKAPVEAAPIQRLHQGGLVQLGAPLHRAEPQYPAMAKAAHVSGTVELECVVGVNGRIVEVKVKSGNALLVKAAVDAAWQWVYAPSKLNGVPIEIVTFLKFNFKLD